MTAPAYRLTRPVTTLRRSSGALQVGLDAAASVLVPSAPPGTEGALRAFRRWRSVPEAAALSGVDLAALEDLVERLAAHGILTARDPGRLGDGVVLMGGGPMAHRVLGHLAASGLDEFRVTDLTAGDPEIGLWRLAAGTARVTLLPHWLDALARPARLVVVAPRTVEPDRWLTDHLRDAGIPHLVVRLEPERAVVGPFVLPGASPCVRCLDLHRRDLDPEWPLLVAQLTSTWAEGGDIAREWAASTAAATAVSWLDRGMPPPVGITLELPEATMSLETRTWRVHPRCGCDQPR